MKANKLSLPIIALLLVIAAFTSCKKDINEITTVTLNEPVTTRTCYIAVEEAHQMQALMQNMVLVLSFK
jgi:hypothetical protein